MTTYKCKAKNPALCPYHGSRLAAPVQLTMKERVQSLFNQTPVYFDNFGKPVDNITVKIEITPITPSSKSKYVVEASGEDYDKVLADATAQMLALEPKELKSGYKWTASVPSGDTDASVTKQYSGYANRESALMKRDIEETLSSAQRINENANLFLNKLKDSSITQSPAGAKAIAVIEAMNSFKFFDYSEDPKWGNAEVSNALDYFMAGKSEYTNRGWGIRVHASYNGNGEMREAIFSLDNQHGSFSQEEVNRVNNKLKNYFEGFNSKS